MAEARSAVRAPRVDYLEEGREPSKDILRALRKCTVRRFFKTRNRISNGLWPTSMYNLAVTTGILSVALIGNWTFVQPINYYLWCLADVLHIHEGFPFAVRIVLVNFAMGVLFFLALLYVRRYTLRILLAYRGWMYEPPRTQSIRTIIWGFIVRCWSGYSPTTYSYQRSLPRMPVPSLKHTLNELMESLAPLYGRDSETFKSLQKQAETFRRTLGKKLQNVLVLRSWWASNYVTDWWEKYIYLMGRNPIAINSNYYIMDQSYWIPTHRQVSRAAYILYQFMTFKRMLDREHVPPLVIRNTIPLCMWQYKRAFSTTRIPGEDIDAIRHYDSSKSKHIVVKCGGFLYKLDVVDSANQLVAPQNLEVQLQWVLDDAVKHKDEVDELVSGLPSMTGIGRTEWWKLRKQYFSSGVNQQSLDLIDTAVLYVVLSEQILEPLSERGKFCMLGDGKTFWFDKSMNLIFFRNGRFGMNCEHSWADAPVVAHISEFSMSKEVLQNCYDDQGFVKPDQSYTQAAIRYPQRLPWKIEEPLGREIQQAIAFNVQNNDDLDLCIVDHDSYGKGVMKKAKVSPDAYIQCAIQLAYYKDAGELALVYESSMTRLYLHGRTETVRSLSSQCADFVRSMADESCSKETRLKALRAACNRHQQLYKDAMNGLGIDRHLFALYVICKGLGYESEFLQNAIMNPWTLSTSQQPQQQMVGTPDCNIPIYKNKVSPGGGFGPVSDKGYGISYMIPGDAKVFFHISSKRSSNSTDSTRFARHLFSSLREMYDLVTGTEVKACQTECFSGGGAADPCGCGDEKRVTSQLGVSTTASQTDVAL